MISPQLIIHQLRAYWVHVSKVISALKRERANLHREFGGTRGWKPHGFAKRKLINENSFAIVCGLLINGFPLANSPSV